MTSKLTILIDSLDKKIDVLKRIQAYNDIQEKSFLETTPDLDSFDEAIAQKDALIEELMRLDDGFETLFEEVKSEVETNRSAYVNEIATMQNQIRTITELSNAVQAKEARNKKLVEEYFRKSRTGIKQGRQQSKAALDYYKSMNNPAVSAYHMMDSKH